MDESIRRIQCAEGVQVLYACNWNERKVGLKFLTFLAWLECELKYENIIVSCKALASDL